MMSEPPTSTNRLSRDFSSLLGDGGIYVRIGPFNVRVEAAVADLHDHLHSFYAGYPSVDENDVSSFHVRIEGRRRLRNPFRPLVRFTVDGRRPHEDMPAEQALAVLEWGINLVIAMRSHCFLMLHSAVLEKNGYALLLPAAPGYGKSTICAALAHRGWRLLSDEFGLIRPGTSEFLPIPRPIALKNDSIDVFRSFAPDAYIGPSIPNTRKGTVAHVRPPIDAIRLQSKPATARRIVFPRWRADADFLFEPLSKSQGFMMLAMNAFNYELLGEAGFQTASTIIERSDCFRLVYSDLDQAVETLDRVAEVDETK